MLQFDGSNFRVLQVTPADRRRDRAEGRAVHREMVFSGGQQLCGWPARLRHGDLSHYNSPIASLTVTLPSTTAIAAGLAMGFVTDNGKSLTVQVNATGGGANPDARHPRRRKRR